MAEVAAKKKVKNGGGSVSRYGLLLIVVLVCIVFALLRPTFYSLGNIMNVISSTVVLCIAGLGLSLVMITGEIDFACGAELATGACVTAVLCKNGVNYFLAVLITLVLCAGIGIVNGLLHTRVGIPGFIATMGVSFVLDGFNKMITNSGRVYSSTWGDIFTTIGQKRVAGIIPISVFILAVVAFAMLIYTEGMTNGRKLYAVGSNSDACRYVGIDARKEKMKSFVISAVLCGLGGIINASQLNAASPYMGTTTLVSLLTMLMLGATFYRIGVFNVPGTIVGALLVNIINNGMVLLGATTWQQYVVQGGIMLFAVTLVSVMNIRARGKG
ncbi:ABC transporter permease [Mediterraneibacter sp. NSJ-55]|uniref:Autoinducer 2 import system permease protein LsrD n=1 Tax=Mediterraneibacter hominis TaxID=2763054 RepID=A0A923LIW5_9FIRM|nr:ABC transporter permease [Mediterraneibacter hominis]MBC5689516.1 ABC transporter permease [Mediterraneibacter hominis]